MTQKCIDSYKQTMQEGDELILVDDASPFNHGFKVDFRHEENKGNAGSWNTCVKLAKNKVVLLSDNDIEAWDWRENMLETLEVADVVFPRVYNCRIAAFEEKHLAGECFMFKKELFDEIGEFDEGYGSYFEDTDWFKRAMLANKKLATAPRTHVIHKSQGTFSKIWSQEKMQEMFERNKKRYEEKFGAEYPFVE